MPLMQKLISVYKTEFVSSDELKNKIFEVIDVCRDICLTKFKKPDLYSLSFYRILNGQGSNFTEDQKKLFMILWVC